MKEGDLFYIHVLDHLLTYEVDQILVIEPEDTDALRPEADKEYVTLLTCTPYGVNSHRLLVRGEKTSDEIVEENDVKEQDAVKKTRDMTEIIAYAAAAFALFSLFVAVVTICIRKIRKKRRRTRGRRKKQGRKAVCKGEEDEKSKKTKKTFCFRSDPPFDRMRDPFVSPHFAAVLWNKDRDHVPAI